MPCLLGGWKKAYCMYFVTQVPFVMEAFAIFRQLAQTRPLIGFSARENLKLFSVKPVSVPCLKLTAATIAVKLRTFVFNQLEFEFDYGYYWTDTMIVLRYIHNTASRFHLFVANRLRLIQSLTNAKQWRYALTKSKTCHRVVSVKQS